MQNHLDLANQENALLKNEIGYLKKQLSDVDRANDKLKESAGALRERDQEVKRLREELSLLKEDCSAHQRQLRAGDQLAGENKRLSEALRNLERKNEEMRRELASLKGDIERLTE